ncbi:PLD nuclease N-terminal domain-containing protein [Nocardioides sp.]|uniref:PLD nuclease N-terminal domain-containing protein n=1 Tax=Nocardioides sp. TaxID=35761 RepID=UPI002ED7F38F
MIKLELLLGVATFALWVFCLVDAIGAPADRIRNLPKVGWILLILFFPFVGSIAWLVAGRPDDAPRRRSPYERETPAYPEYDRPGRAAAVDPEKDEAFLRQVRERAEAQRRAYEAQRRRERQADGEAGE